MSNEKSLLSPEDYDLYDEMAQLELRNAMPAPVTAERSAWYAAIRAIIRGSEAIGKKVGDCPELAGLVREIWERVFGYDAGCKKTLGHALAEASARLEAPPVDGESLPNVSCSTYKGLDVYLYQPELSVIHPEDIAHALSNVCVHQGHTGWFYSIAQHSVELSRLCEPKFALEALLHDAVRAYLPEIPSPGKKYAWARMYRQAEEGWRKGVAAQFGLLHPLPVDLEVLHDRLEHWELWELFESLPVQVRVLCPKTPLAGLDKLTPWLPEEAEEAFLERLWELQHARVHSGMGTALEQVGPQTE